MTPNKQESQTKPNAPRQGNDKRDLERVKRDAKQAWNEVKHGITNAADGVKSTVADLGAAAGSLYGAPVGAPMPFDGELTGGIPPINVNVEYLQSCLRGELSAVETYALALQHANDHNARMAFALADLRDRHAQRVARLRARLHDMAAEPATKSGVWGTFARLVQTGADVFGDRASVIALEEGESHGLAVYSGGLGGCDMATREFVVTELLPEQEKSYDLCRSLRQFITSD